MNIVDFKVPLSNSELFDFHAIATAKNLCSMFPPLDYEVIEIDGIKYIHIYGELNDFWYNKWNKAVLNIGD